jgi:general secretion pathway protein J
MTRQAHPARARSSGFTLLELLVAMFIAAIIFAMGYGAINQGVKNRITLQEQQAKLLELQTAVRVIEQDFVQLAPRPIRQPVGNDFYPALMSTQVGSGVRSSFSSSSSTSPTSRSADQTSRSADQTSRSADQTSRSADQTSRSADQTSRSGGQSSSSSTAEPLVSFTRAGWTNPTGAQRPGLQRVAYYFDKDTLRREHWLVLDPTQTSKTVKRDLLTHLKSVSFRFYSQAGWETQWPRSALPEDLPSRPLAVEVTLETEDWGKIVRLIELPG